MMGLFYWTVSRESVKLRVYLDTSVFSAYYDNRHTDRQAETEELWKRLDTFEAATSDLAAHEIAETGFAQKPLIQGSFLCRSQVCTKSPWAISWLQNREYKAARCC